VLLEGVGGALGSDQVYRILHLLSERSVAYINHSDVHDACELYDAVLECKEDGSWTWKTDRAWRSAAKDLRPNKVGHRSIVQADPA
jgi:putative ATP-binding cassette transporter